jgi:hypothetical protein
VTFEPLDNGRSLRVTKRIYDDNLRQPVAVQSFYRKSSDEAEWGVVSARRASLPAGAATSASHEIILGFSAIGERTIREAFKLRVSRGNVPHGVA